MGLKEKQAMANQDFGWSERRIKEYTGKDVKVEMDADSFSNDMDAILSSDQRGAQAIANAIANVCRNDIGKEAFNDKKVTKVILKNQAPGSRSVSFKNGSLIVACSFASSSDFFSDSELMNEIENQL